MKALYTAEVHTRGGRQGTARSSDGMLDVVLARPTERGGTNPEQLFAAAYAACFDGALKLVAKQRGQEIPEIDIRARVTLNVSDEGAYILSVELHAGIPGVPHREAMELMEAAHAICPYSNATRGNIQVTLSVEAD